jgi:hypothetical protein
MNTLKKLIQESARAIIAEEYQDKYKMVGLLITNIDLRPQKEIYSDIRAITGITVISSTEPLKFSEQNQQRFQAILSVKVDGYPFMKAGGFSRDKLQEIIKQIYKVDGVISFKVAPDKITAI